MFSLLMCLCSNICYHPLKSFWLKMFPLLILFFPFQVSPMSHSSHSWRHTVGTSQPVTLAGQNFFHGYPNSTSKKQQTKQIFYWAFTHAKHLLLLNDRFYDPIPLFAQVWIDIGSKNKERQEPKSLSRQSPIF